MVFFSCDGCGDTLKKNQVDAHAGRCRLCDSVSCVDCSVSFYGDDYRAHTSCISEAERYEKTVYRGPKKGDAGNNGVGKKLSPQESWNNLIAAASTSASCPASIRSYVMQLAELDNVPRKEKQFRNFSSNSLKLRGRDATKIVDEVWKHLCVVREAEQEKKNSSAKELQSENEAGTKAERSSVGESATVHTTKRKTKSQAVDITRKNDEFVAPTKDLTAKSVSRAMKKELKKAPQRKMKLKELRRKVKDRLLLKETSKKELKQLIASQFEETSGSKKMKLEGKVVILLT